MVWVSFQCVQSGFVYKHRVCLGSHFLFLDYKPDRLASSTPDENNFQLSPFVYYIRLHMFRKFYSLLNHCHAAHGE